MNLQSHFLKLHNTYTGAKEVFEPLMPGAVSMYTCGPTVYDYAHIGNWRAYIFEDVLRRTLQLLGHRVTQVMNLTDVDDKTIRGALGARISLAQYTQPFAAAFFRDLDLLGIERAEHYPRATEHVPEMIALIERLIRKGYAYEAGGSVYYRVSAFPDYGKLSKKDLEANILGARVDHDEYTKESLMDFALWKKGKIGEPAWESPFGPGRPGWHIECSVMSMKYLGETFDIHTGGEDNIFPHHENEIAQSVAATNAGFARYWLHCRFLLVDGHKMSKSKANFYTLDDLMKRGYQPMAIRYLLLSHHYRRPLNFTFQSMDSAGEALARIREFKLRLEGFKPPLGRKLSKEGQAPSGGQALSLAHEQFVACLCDDLNTSGALGVFFDFLHAVNKLMDAGQLSGDERDQALRFVGEANRVLGLERVFKNEEAPSEIEKLVRERERFRSEKAFREADALRDQIAALGYLLEDTPQGVKVKRK